MDMTDNPKCILYTRVSTPGQAEHLRAYARTSGLEKDPLLRNERFTDEQKYTKERKLV